MLTQNELVKKMLKRPAVKAEYEAQAAEFALLDELLSAEARALLGLRDSGLSQNNEQHGDDH